jgi:hypothetical protein
MSKIVNKISTDINNAKWHTLWKKRMEHGKPREGDYNFIIWQNGSETIIEPWDKSVPPSIFTDGEWVMLANDYGKER